MLYSEDSVYGPVRIHTRHSFSSATPSFKPWCNLPTLPSASISSIGSRDSTTVASDTADFPKSTSSSSIPTLTSREQTKPPKPPSTYSYSLSSSMDVLSVASFSTNATRHRDLLTRPTSPSLPDRASVSHGLQECLPTDSANDPMNVPHNECRDRLHTPETKEDGELTDSLQESLRGSIKTSFFNMRRMKSEGSLRADRRSSGRPFSPTLRSLSHSSSSPPHFSASPSNSSNALTPVKRPDSTASKFKGLIQKLIRRSKINVCSPSTPGRSSIPPTEPSDSVDHLILSGSESSPDHLSPYTPSTPKCDSTSPFGAPTLFKRKVENDFSTIEEEIGLDFLNSSNSSVESNSSDGSLEGQKSKQTALSAAWELADAASFRTAAEPLSHAPSRPLERTSSVAAEAVEISCRLIPAAHLSNATDGFARKNVIGKGKAGVVYRGMLFGCNVAVKKIRPGTSRRSALEFESQVEMLSQLRHPHLVLMMGQCPSEGAVVFELMAGGNLLQRLGKNSAIRRPIQGAKPVGTGVSGASSEGDAMRPVCDALEAVASSAPPPLSWASRLRILAGVCRALLFLHQQEKPIIHRNIKPENILLDANDSAKISDVGLARILSDDEDNTTINLNASLGYMDPEAIVTSSFTPSSDVYSLGLVILVLLTGIDKVASVHKLLSKYNTRCDKGRDKLVKVIVANRDTRASGAFPPECVEAVARLALRCVERNRGLRPDLAGEVRPLLERMSEELKLEDGRKGEMCVEHLICPLSKKQFVNPVLAADGFTYEESSIKEWLKNNDTSPVTKEPLAHKHLTPNQIFLSMLDLDY